MTPIFVITSQWVSIVMNVQCRSLLQIYAEYTCFYFCPERILSVFKLPGDTTITHSCKQQKNRKWPNMFCVYISVLLISVQIYIAAVTKTSSMLTHCFWGAMSKLVPSIASVRASSATTTTFLIAKGPILTLRQTPSYWGSHVKLKLLSDSPRFIMGIPISVRRCLKTWCPLLLLWFIFLLRISMPQ